MGKNAVAWFGKYTLAGRVAAQGEGWVRLNVTTVTQDGTQLPHHHLVGTERSFSLKDVLLSD